MNSDLWLSHCRRTVDAIYISSTTSFRCRREVLPFVLWIQNLAWRFYTGCDWVARSCNKRVELDLGIIHEAMDGIWDMIKESSMACAYVLFIPLSIEVMDGVWDAIKERTLNVMCIYFICTFIFPYQQYVFIYTSYLSISHTTTYYLTMHPRARAPILPYLNLQH